ncbi:hypothetical protein PCASD_24716 [Puccinia coronata f. sp. avenae]|nr:hypothetical protein PCASD_24716 [Puccinia coronata f. sp. avenae]
MASHGPPVHQASTPLYASFNQSPSGLVIIAVERGHSVYQESMAPPGPLAPLLPVPRHPQPLLPPSPPATKNMVPIPAPGTMGNQIGTLQPVAQIRTPPQLYHGQENQGGQTNVNPSLMNLDPTPLSLPEPPSPQELPDLSSVPYTSLKPPLQRAAELDRAVGSICAADLPGTIRNSSINELPDPSATPLAQPPLRGYNEQGNQPVNRPLSREVVITMERTPFKYKEPLASQDPSVFLVPAPQHQPVLQPQLQRPPCHSSSYTQPHERRDRQLEKTPQCNHTLDGDSQFFHLRGAPHKRNKPQRLLWISSTLI